MLNTSTLFTVFVLSASTAVQAAPEPCHFLDKPLAMALFDRWNQSLQSGDAEKVAALYTADAVLLPTVSNTPRTDHDGKVDYFKHFIANKPVGRIDSSTLIASCNGAIDTGTYTFRFQDNSTIQARYTFSYAWVDDQWLITSHHSSAVPEA